MRMFPAKPLRMRWATYERLRQELDEAEGHACGGFVAWETAVTLEDPRREARVRANEACKIPRTQEGIDSRAAR
jgi:hypothetical protein